MSTSTFVGIGDHLVHNFLDFTQIELFLFYFILTQLWLLNPHVATTLQERMAPGITLTASEHVSKTVNHALVAMMLNL